MTPCRTEKVDFSKKNKKQKNKNTNRITKKTNRQEESPEETKKTRKKNKTCIFRSFCVFLFLFFSCFFLGFGFLVCFFCLLWFCFCLLFLSNPILCVVGLINLRHNSFPSSHVTETYRNCIIWNYWSLCSPSPGVCIHLRHQHRHQGHQHQRGARHAHSAPSLAEHIRTRQRRSSDGNNLKKIIKIRLHFVEGSVSEFYTEVLCKIFCRFLRLRAPSGSCHQVLLTPRLSPMATSDVWPGRKRSEKHQVSRTEISRSLEYHWILFSILIILQLPKIPTSKHQKASRWMIYTWLVIAIW